MSSIEYLRGIGFALLSSVFAAGSASAAILSEADVKGGAFGSWKAPTEVGAGITTVTGTGSQNSFDHLVFTALPAGKQDITLRFSAPDGIGYSYAAGGDIKYSFSPLKYEWDGITLGKVDLKHGQPEQPLTLSLGEEFKGLLYFALYFTHGKEISYAINAPSNAIPEVVTPAPVPVPASILLIGSALGGLGLMRLRSRRAA